MTADQRQYTGESYDYPEYFRGVCEALDSLGPGEFMVSPGDIDPPVGVRWTLDRYLGEDYRWFPVVGNHETETASDMEYLRAYDLDPHHTGWFTSFKKGPRYCEETTYSFDFENCHFVAINEYYDGFGDTALDGDVGDSLYRWLADDLAATNKDHIFVFGHEPAYPQPDRDNLRERHMHDSLNKYPANRDRFWDLLAEYGVLAYFCGHTHNHSVYEREGVWQIDAGHCRGEGDQGAPSTFILVHVDGAEVLSVAYRDAHDNGEYDYDDVIHYDWLTNPISDTTSFTTTGVSGDGGAPVALRIGSDPNPFNPETRIRYELPSAGPVMVRIVNVRGAVTRTLVDEPRPAGVHFVDWDGTTDRGEPVPSGTYFATVKTGAETVSRKILLLR